LNALFYENNKQNQPHISFAVAGSAKNTVLLKKEWIKKKIFGENSTFLTIVPVQISTARILINILQRVNKFQLFKVISFTVP